MNDAELLATGINNAAVRLGMIKQGTELTGPQCLMLLGNIEDMAAKTQVVPAECNKMTDLLEAAKAFYNATVADPEIRITSVHINKRDAAALAAERLRAAIAESSTTPAQEDCYCGGWAEVINGKREGFHQSGCPEVKNA